MNTTDLYVEQVLIGALVFLALVMPWAPEILYAIKDWEAVDRLGGGALVLGISFLLGILFDRFADTLTEPLERHQRLHFAFEQVVKKCKQDERLTFSAAYGDDPFAEGELRMQMLRETGHVVDWVNYHRSRIRLARAMAVYLPALSFTSTIALGRHSGGHWSTPLHLVAGLSFVLLAYLIAAVWSNFLAKYPTDYWFSAPKTYERDKALSYAKKHGYAIDEPGQKPLRSSGQKLIVGILMHNPIALGGMILLAAAIGMGFWRSNAAMLAVSVIGAVATIMAAWSWWRIGYTYRTYLAQLTVSIRTEHRKLDALRYRVVRPRLLR